MMPRLPVLGDALSRLLEVNARYYTTLGRVTADFLRELVVTLEVPLRAPEEPRSAAEETRRGTSNGGQYARHETAPPSPPPAPPAPSQQTIILLEAEADQTAMGMFLVANQLDHEVLARPQAWPFYDPPGIADMPRLVFDPEVISLAPHERVLVKVIATVDRSMQPEVRYRCEVSVPALADTRIPIVIRRRPDRPMVVAVTVPSGAETHAGEAAAGAAAHSLEGHTKTPRKPRKKKKPNVDAKRAKPAASPEETQNGE